jgi:hypothetical protein
MLDRARGALLWTGAVWLWTVPVLFGDTAAGMRAFRQKDYPTAYREWRAAADQGQAEAQYNLGILYLKGLGVARIWMKHFAGYVLPQIRARLTPSFRSG